MKIRETTAVEQQQKKAEQVDDLFEKIKKKEAELAKLDEELFGLKKEHEAFPDQYKQLEDHFSLTNQEIRRRELEL